MCSWVLAAPSYVMQAMASALLERCHGHRPQATSVARRWLLLVIEHMIG